MARPITLKNKAGWQGPKRAEEGGNEDLGSLERLEL